MILNIVYLNSIKFDNFFVSFSKTSSCIPNNNRIMLPHMLDGITIDVTNKSDTAKFIMGAFLVACTALVITNVKIV